MIYKIRSWTIMCAFVWSHVLIAPDFELNKIPQTELQKFQRQNNKISTDGIT